MRLHSILRSSQSPGRKFRQFFIRHAVTDLDGVAAHFAIFHVLLFANGEVQHHRNLFTAMRTGKGMFHIVMILT